eukprot:4724960-Alexandrium_andersonii.AAC.1
MPLREGARPTKPEFGGAPRSRWPSTPAPQPRRRSRGCWAGTPWRPERRTRSCLLYTSDAADDM